MILFALFTGFVASCLLLFFEVMRWLPWSLNIKALLYFVGVTLIIAFYVKVVSRVSALRSWLS